MKSNGSNLDVLLVSVSDQVGGTEQVIKMLGTGLKSKGVSCEIMSSGPGNNKWFAESGAKVSYARELRPPFGGKLLGTVRLAQRFRPYRNGVVNIHYPLCEPYNRHYLALKIAGCKKVAISLHHPGMRPHETRERIRSVMTKISPIVATTPALVEYLMENNLAERNQFVVILPGVMPQSPMPKAEARQKMGLPADRFIVGSISRIDHDKRIPLLIDTVRRCHDQGQKIHVAVGGRGPESEDVAAYGKEKLGDYFTMVGWVEDSNVLYSSLDALVLLSEVEGFGLVYAEAAGHGVPSIGCRGGGIAYAIDEGVTGGLVDNVQPVEPAAELLSRWASDASLATTLGVNARKRYDNLFNLDRMVREYTEVFERLPDYKPVTE